jgi:hypothetical protein
MTAASDRHSAKLQRIPARSPEQVQQVADQERVVEDAVGILSTLLQEAVEAARAPLRALLLDDPDAQTDDDEAKALHALLIQMKVGMDRACTRIHPAFRRPRFRPPRSSQQPARTRTSRWLWLLCVRPWQLQSKRWHPRHSPGSTR